jgi:hypothetical protein
LAKSRDWLGRAARGEITSVRFTLHFVVLAGLLATLGISQLAEGYFTRGVSTSRDFAPIPYTDGNPMAVNTFLDLEADPAVVERSLDMIAEDGFGYIRQIFGWFDIEPERKGLYRDRFGNSSWEKFDRIVELAEERGIEIIVRLEKPPRWARAGQPNLEQFPDGPPNEVSDWVDYVEAVVRRYRDQLTYFQLWNEPNIAGEWGGQPIDPRGYVDLLQAGYQAAKRANPDCVVLLAGLAPTDQTGPDNLSDLLFLQQVYDNGGAAYFDIAAVMVYGYGYSPFDRRVNFGRNNFSRPIQTREIMVRNGDAATPVWAVEYGWVSLPDDWSGEPSPWGEPVSPETQADYLVQGYLRAQAEWPWMGVMAVWAFRWPQPPDDPAQVANPTRGFALVEHDFGPRSAWEALARAGPLIKAAGVGSYTITASTAERTRRGQPVSISFRGQRLDVIIVPGDGGVLRIETDRGEPVSVELEPGGGQQVRAAILADGWYTVDVWLQSEPSDDPPSLVGFVVSRRPLATQIYPWINAVLLFALAATAASLGWALGDAYRRRYDSPPLSD